MKNSLKDLTKNDWNTLFPVVLVDHNPDWKHLYQKEKQKIVARLGKEIILRIEHFGSTSISWIKAKPYIDIIIEVPKSLLFSEEVIDGFENIGYQYFKVPERGNITAYMSFAKGYNLDGIEAQIYHIHVCSKENAMLCQIAFRDYLNANEAYAKEYEILKMTLAAKFKNDRGAYVLGKDDFVSKTMDLINKTTKKNTNIFPTLTSTLSAEALGDFVKQKYGLDNQSNCKLFRTGINHTYFIESDKAKYVLRVYFRNWRSKQEILEEINLLNTLKSNDISISYPIADKNGNFIQEINALEGMRYAVLFSFAEGGKIRFMDNETCAAIGSLMAKIHNVTLGKKVQRIDYNVVTMLQLPYMFANKIFPDTLEEMRFIKEQSTMISRAFEQIDTKYVKQGIIHLDIWYDNMSITDKNDITIFDFDFCGNGPLVFDVAYFCKQLFHIEVDKDIYEQKVESFLNGYKSIRSLSDQEMKLIPSAGAAIWIFYLGIQSQRFDWSNIFLSENYLKMYIGRMKSWLEYSIPFHEQK
ncbi:GrpB family protein [Chryseobacterium sp. JV558]|uniref:GrpB family protein n=1 Tax=Chryseobacterium sp. JV558 TaxID=2663236 RepID=UPI00299CE9B2|nr:GrpB family protein [Chryseobacterium sp. JV558]